MILNKPLCRALFLAVLSTVVGCGKEEQPTSKPTLNESEKQQVIDLDKQRQEEWKTTPKKDVEK